MEERDNLRRDIDMKQEKTVLKEDWYMVWRYLFYTFTIAWVTEFLLIALYHFLLQILFSPRHPLSLKLKPRIFSFS